MHSRNQEPWIMNRTVSGFLVLLAAFCLMALPDRHGALVRGLFNGLYVVVRHVGKAGRDWLEYLLVVRLARRGDRDAARG